MKHVEVSKFSLARPFKHISAFIKKQMPMQGEPAFRRHGTILFSKTYATLTLLALLTLAKLNVEAKPGPFYNSFSLFSYTLMTPTMGMFGDKTNFWVSEAGVAYKLPFSIKFGPIDTVNVRGAKIATHKGNISFTPMLLGGITRAEGLPPAETNFWKFALTTNITHGKSTFSPGARIIGAKSLEWSFHHTTMPPENFIDADFGLRYKFQQSRRDTTSTIRSASVEITWFNARGTIRDPYYVSKASVGFKHGWSAEVCWDTRVTTPSFGVDKMFAWDNYQKMLLLGAGYEPGSKSICGYVGVVKGPFMIMAIYQSEGADPSYHTLISFSPSAFFKHGASGHKTNHGQPAQK